MWTKLDLYSGDYGTISYLLKIAPLGLKTKLDLYSGDYGTIPTEDSTSRPQGDVYLYSFISAIKSSQG